MKSYFAGLAIAGLFVIAPALPGHAQDAAPTAPQTETAPANVARPSIAPKTAEPSSPATAEPAPRRKRRYAHRHGSYRTAYRQPFPIYWPHFHRHRIYWNRIPWRFGF